MLKDQLTWKRQSSECGAWKTLGLRATAHICTSEPSYCFVLKRSVSRKAGLTELIDPKVGRKLCVLIGLLAPSPGALSPDPSVCPPVKPHVACACAGSGQLQGWGTRALLPDPSFRTSSYGLTDTVILLPSDGGGDAEQQMGRTTHEVIMSSFQGKFTLPARAWGKGTTWPPTEPRAMFIRGGGGVLMCTGKVLLAPDLLVVAGDSWREGWPGQGTGGMAPCGLFPHSWGSKESRAMCLVPSRTPSRRRQLYKIDFQGWGTWVAQLVKHPTLDFGSDRDLPVWDQAPPQALDSTEPAWDSASPLCPSLAHALSLSLKINK